MDFPLTLSDDRVEALVEDAKQALRAEEYRRAERLFRRVGRYRPDDARWLNGTAVAREYSGDRDTARDLYRQAADLGHATAAWNLGRIAFADGDLRTARTALEQGVERQLVHAANLLGDVCVQMHDFAAAERAYVHAAKLGHDDALNNLGLLYFEMDEPARAIAPLTRALELGHVFAEHNLGSAHHRLGDLDAASSWYTRSYRRHGNLQSLENLGHVWGDAGRSEDGAALVRASDALYEGRALSPIEQRVVDEVEAAGLD